jgi:hypothetical protein
MHNKHPCLMYLAQKEKKKDKLKQDAQNFNVVQHFIFPFPLFIYLLFIDFKF